MSNPAYKFTPCKHHPGCNVRNHPCQHKDKNGVLCGYSGERKDDTNHKPEPETLALRLVTDRDVENMENEGLLYNTGAGPQMEVTRVDTETGELVNPAQLILGLDLPALTQRKGQTDGMTRADARGAVMQAIDNMREGDRVTIGYKDGGITVKVQTAWVTE